MSEVAPEVGERRIAVSDNAAQRIALLKQQEDAPDAFLRIAVSVVSGLCCVLVIALWVSNYRRWDMANSPTINPAV